MVYPHKQSVCSGVLGVHRNTYTMHSMYIFLLSADMLYTIALLFHWVEFLAIVVPHIYKAAIFSLFLLATGHVHICTLPSPAASYHGAHALPRMIFCDVLSHEMNKFDIHFPSLWCFTIHMHIQKTYKLSLKTLICVVWQMWNRGKRSKKFFINKHLWQKCRKNVP